MRWYVYRGETVYGPYEKDQLAAFLTSDDLVLPEGEKEWVPAEAIPEIKEVLAGFVSPRLEWYLIPKGKPQRGPFTRTAVIKIIRRGEVAPTDSIQHESWPEAVPLEKTRIYHFAKDPNRDPNSLPEEDLVAAPRKKDEETPAPPKKRRIKFDFELTPGIIAAVCVLLLGPPVLWGGYQFYYRGSSLEAYHQYGTPSGDCTKDEASRKLCEKSSPKLCGCETKGSCGMSTCEMYAKIRRGGS